MFLGFFAYVYVERLGEAFVICLMLGLGLGKGTRSLDPIELSSSGFLRTENHANRFLILHYNYRLYRFRVELFIGNNRLSGSDSQKESTRTGQPVKLFPLLHKYT